MTDPTEHRIQITLTTPPVAQFAKGNMANVRANTVPELEALLGELRSLAERDPIVAQFLDVEVTPEQAIELVKQTFPGTTEEPAAPAADDGELANPALLKVVAAKTGQPAPEGMTKAAAKAAIAEAKKGGA